MVNLLNSRQKDNSSRPEIVEEARLKRMAQQADHERNQ